MKPLLALLTALTLLPAPATPAAPSAQGAPADDAPDCSVALTLPQSGLDLHLDYRQVGPDLSKFREPQGASESDVKQLRIQAHLALGSSLASDVWLTIGDRQLKPGKHPLGFTLSHDDTMHLFLVDGTEAFPLSGETFAPGFESPRLVLQMQYVSRNEARLLWHWKKAAGSIRLGLGTPDAAAPFEAPVER